MLDSLPTFFSLKKHQAYVINNYNFYKVKTKKQAKPNLFLIKNMCALHIQIVYSNYFTFQIQTDTKASISLI